MVDTAELQIYFSQIQAFPPLPAEHQVELRKRYLRDNDLAARQQMIVSNLRLVVHFAKRHMHRGLSLADLIAEGNIGLIKAVEKYDPNLNVRFSTYAVWWIRNRMRLALVKARQPFRLPGYLVEAANRWKSAAALLEDDLGRKPNLREMAQYLEISLKRAQVIQTAISTFGYTLGQADEDDAPAAELLNDPNMPSPEEMALERELLGKLQHLLEHVEEREAHVIRRRYGLEGLAPSSLKEIGDELGLSRERTRQIEASALQKLNAHLSADRLPGTRDEARIVRRSHATELVPA